MVFGKGEWVQVQCTVIVLALAASLFYSSKYASCTQPHITFTPKNTSTSSPLSSVRTPSSSVPHYGAGGADAALSSDSSGNLNVHVLSILQQLQISQYEAESIMKSNSSEYNWLGNSFANPPGVPTFTARQIKAYFERRNVLFIGDSTSRRVSNNIYGIITADNLDDVKVHEIDYDLKTRNTNCSTDQQDRAMLKVPNSFRGMICKDVIVGAGSYKGRGNFRTVVQPDTPSISTLSSETNHDTNSNNNSTQMVRNKTVKFDRINSVCYSSIKWQWRDVDKLDMRWADNFLEQSLLNQQNLNPGLQAIYKDYDLVIISIGIWDLMSIECHVEGVPLPLRLRRMLNAVERNTPDDLQVVIRTPGFESNSPDANNSLQFDAIDITRDFFHNMRTTRGNDDNRYKNFTLVDWGSVVSKRSFGKDKIISRDHNGAHYGLDARLLLVQHLMHELVKADLMKANTL